MNVKIDYNNSGKLQNIGINYSVQTGGPFVNRCSNYFLITVCKNLLDNCLHIMQYKQYIDQYYKSKNCILGTAENKFNSENVRRICVENICYFQSRIQNRDINVDAINPMVGIHCHN